MGENRDLTKSMEQTIEYGNLDFLADIGEIAIDAVLNEGVLKEVPILGSIVGLGKCIKNVYDIQFAKKLIVFLLPLKEVEPEKRKVAIKKWEENENYRGQVGDTLLGMIQRCDDAIKAKWLSKLFYELVLKRNEARLFMRAEKALSSLSVMDVQVFLNMPQNHYGHIKENECEPFIGSGLYQNPKLSDPVDESLDLSDTYCEPTEVGVWIYYVLNGIPMPEYKDNRLI